MLKQMVSCYRRKKSFLASLSSFHLRTSNLHPCWQWLLWKTNETWQHKFLMLRCINGQLPEHVLINIWTSHELISATKDSRAVLFLQRLGNRPVLKLLNCSDVPPLMASIISLFLTWLKEACNIYLWVLFCWLLSTTSFSSQEGRSIFKCLFSFVLDV